MIGAAEGDVEAELLVEKELARGLDAMAGERGVTVSHLVRELPFLIPILTRDGLMNAKIARALGGEPPEGFNYELFLDEKGQKISKSKGNGLTIDGVYQTPTLQFDSDTVDLDDSELDALLGEALYLLCFKDPGRAPRAAQWHQNFVETVVEHNGRLNAANAFRRPEGIDLNRSRVPISVEVKS